MEETSRNVKWLFSEEELTNTPSVRAGITLEQEMTFRQKQAMLIQTVGLKSGLTQLAVNTSVIFMHRFFMHRPVKAFPRLHLALGFAFAGGKVEESARKLEHLIRTAVDVIRVNRNKEFMDKSDPLTYEMDAQWKPKLDALISNNCNIESTAYQEMRKLVLECETEIYAVIGFQLQIVHPHNYVIRMCALLGAENIKDISQYAYNLATASSQLTMLCLKHRPETIATMCLNIAAKAHSVRFEPMKDSNLKWYQVIDPSTDFSEIEAVSEEFLHLIKGCQLLPSWMQNLARMSRANNRLPGPSRAPGTSVFSGPQVAKQGHQPAATASSATAVPASSQSVPQQAKLAQPTSTGALSSQGLELSRQAGRLGGSQLLGEAVLSPVNKPGALDVGGSAVTAEADVPAKDQIPSTYPRPHVVSGSSGQIMGGSSSQMVRPAGGGQHHHQHQQQHRVHPHNRPPNQPAPPAGTSAAKPSQPGSLHPSNSRSVAPQHTAPPGAHMPHLQALPRSSHDRLQHHQDPNHPPDTSRPHSESVKHSHDPSRQHRDHYRSHDVPARSHESTRHRHVERSQEVDSRHPASLPEPATLRTEPSRLSPHTPPISPTQLKSVNSPELAPDISQSHPKLSDAAADLTSNTTSLSPEDIHNSDIDTQKQRPMLNQGSKLSLTMYRERAASAKSRVPSEQGAGKEDSNISFPTADELHMLGHQSESATDSPADVRHTTPTSDLSSFSKPQDSPSNPRIKIKVKRDPSSGERHSVKYADSGLKIKIKPLLRSETGSGGDTSAGPGMAGLASTSSTPREEGEIVEDTPPSSGDSEQKSERLKIRLSVPKADQSSATHSRRESDQGSNGFSGDRERDRDSGHRSHHHSHHRGHHHSKSKKHSKHDRSRHDAKSSKRSSTALDYHEERPAKTSRGETYSSGEGGHRHGSYSEFSSSNSSRSLQHQNSGFSINDAFSSTMPHNIFHEEDDEGLQGQPPITPTSDAVPPHHQKFHQLMAQHRAKVEAAKKPPLPKGPPPPPPPSSPPPPPPSSPPTL